MKEHLGYLGAFFLRVQKFKANLAILVPKGPSMGTVAKSESAEACAPLMSRFEDAHTGLRLALP